jgi:hypothetical protein
MPTFIALDVAIGLTFLYLLLAIVCTAVNEWISTVFRLRAHTLKRAVERLLDAPNGKIKETRDTQPKAEHLSHAVMNHALIRSLSDWRKTPLYIPPKRFVGALLDTLDKHPHHAEADETDAGTTEAQTDRKRTNTIKTDVDHIQAQLTALAKAHPIRSFSHRRFVTGQGDETDARGADSATIDQSGTGLLEDWFNEAMDRASGWYKRQMLWITLAVASVVTVAANADTLVAARIIWHDPTTRSMVVAQASSRARRQGLTTRVQQADYSDRDVPFEDTGGKELADPAATGAKPRAGKAVSSSRESAGATETTQGQTTDGSTTIAEEANGSEEDESRSNEVEDDRTTGLTDGEKSALSQLIGWSREFAALNRDECTKRQHAIDRVCRSGETPSSDCKKALDESIADGICSQGMNVLEPTDTFQSAQLIPLVKAHLIGWFITMVALSMGAPFWFDTLQRFVNIRGGKKVEGDSAERRRK